MSADEIEVTGPYESAFDALENEDRAASLRVKSTLANRLMEYMEDHSLTQTEAADHFRVNQSRVSLLVNGRISKFTIDYLIDMCDAAGISWDINRDDVYASA